MSTFCISLYPLIKSESKLEVQIVTVETEVFEVMQAYLSARMNGDIEREKCHTPKTGVMTKVTRKLLKDWHLSYAIGNSKLDISIDFRTVEVVVEGHNAYISPIRIDTSKGRTYKISAERHRWCLADRIHASSRL